MNNMPKIVFSKSMDKASWKNTRLIKGDIAEEMRRVKNESGEGMVILGSGSIVSQLAQKGLIDEFQVIINPVVLGKGKSMFAGVTQRLDLKLIKTRAFGNGNVVMSYQPK